MATENIELELHVVVEPMIQIKLDSNLQYKSLHRLFKLEYEDNNTSHY